MIVRTTWRFAQPPEIIWPLLCDSRMEPSKSWLFRLGLPQPRQCRLPNGQGGVGSARQCISDRGVIDQTIVAWDKPNHLAFRMEGSDMNFRAFVSSLVDDFELAPTPEGGTMATRITSVHVIGWFRGMKSALVRVGLKKVHRFVFRAWERLASVS